MAARKKTSTRSKAARKKGTTRGRRQPQKPYRMISLDGGGIRGVMTATWLAAFERKLGGRIADHVDLIAGTSTGSILASALCLRIPASDIVELYRVRGRDIFPGTTARLWDRLGRTFTQGASAPKYSDEGLELALRDCLGDARMSDLPDSGPKLLITAYNTLTRNAEVFKSWKREDYGNLPLWEAAKASSSAPTFFPAHVTRTLGSNMALIDGGVAANNPSACAIAEAIKINSKSGSISLEDFVLGSFGTGESARPITIRQAREWGPLEWAVPVISVLMDGAADTTSYIASQLLSKDSYFRFDTPLDKAFDDMDDASMTNIEALIAVAAHYLKNEKGEDMLKALADRFMK